MFILFINFFFVNLNHVKKKADVISTQTLKKSNSFKKFVKLTGLNDLDLNNRSKFLIGVFNLDKIKCLILCNVNLECAYVLIKSNKCFICDINAIGYLSLSNGDQSVLFKKDLNGGFYSKIFFSFYYLLYFD